MPDWFWTGWTGAEVGLDNLIATFLQAPSGMPVPVVTDCPRCKLRHVDRGAWMTRRHSTHICDGCYLQWKVEGRGKFTVGVADYCAGSGVPTRRADDGVGGCVTCAAIFAPLANGGPAPEHVAGQGLTQPP